MDEWRATGTTTAESRTDAVYGSTTAKWAAHYQQSRDLPATGFADPALITLLVR